MKAALQERGQWHSARHTGQIPVLERWFAVSRDPHRGYKTTWSTAASTVTEIELNLEAVLQINCLLLRLPFVFVPRTWWLLSLVLLPVTSPIFIPLYHPYLDTFFFTSVTLWQSSQAPEKTLQGPYSNDVFKNVFFGSQQKLKRRHEKSKQDSTRSCCLQGALGKTDQFCRDPSCLIPFSRLHFCFSSFFTLSHSAVFLLSSVWTKIPLPTAWTPQWHGRKAKAEWLRHHFNLLPDLSYQGPNTAPSSLWKQIWKAHTSALQCLFRNVTTLLHHKWS